MGDDCAAKLSGTLSGEKWKRIGTRKRAGILAPLFSVYSKKSAGIGDFEDLKPLIDFCFKTGNSILQLLPMNEVGATFCPYDAISSFALEPAYISIENPALLRDKRIKEKISDLKKRFPAGNRNVDYDIKEEKISLLREIFDPPDDTGSREFKTFLEDNAYWIEDFALFKTLKKINHGKPWYEWDAEYRDRDEDALDAFRSKNKKEILFQKWVQWIASEQFKEARKYAGSKDIKLCGDLPILTSRDSADVWAHPEFFKLDFAAGAPPDMYCAKGQRWGMPTYNWEKISSDNHGYLKEKLKYAEIFYDILRVDHVVGLFRIWSIPYNESAVNEGLIGSFDPPEESAWREHGRKILAVIIENTKMLLVGEDLGIIPRDCPETLKDFGIPGNDVQRWVKDWNVKHDFLPPSQYRTLSVAMLSTHDTTDWPAWWDAEAGTVDEKLFARKAADRGMDYEGIKNKLFDARRSGHGRLRWLESVETADTLAEILGRKKEELADFIDMYENTFREKEKLWKIFGFDKKMKEKCDPDIIRAALKITLGSRSLFCVETLMDYLFLDGILKGEPYRFRINRPGTVNKENWSLTMPLSLEELLDHPVCGRMRELIESSGRA